jgi:class 3 adenylate cyclase
MPVEPPEDGSDVGGPGDVRVSDAERQSVVDRLSRAVGDGLVTLDEFADHAGAAYAARTRAELERVTRDLRLPVVAPAATPAPAAEIGGAAAGEAKPKRRWIVAIMGGEERRGRWRVPRRQGAFALMGGVDLDLRDALLEHDEVEITAWAIMGGVTIIVPEGIAVESEGFVLMGGRTNRVKGHPLPGGPVIRVRGYGMWGGVEVESRPPGSDPSADERPRPAAGWSPPPLPSLPGHGPPPPPIPSPPLPPRHRHDHDHDRDRDRRRSRRDETPAPAAEPPAPHTGIVTIVCTDIVGSTRLADTLGDQKWRDLVGAHNAIVRTQLARHDGLEIKTSGDGFLVTFPSARRAVSFALDVHDAVRSLDLDLRIGLHAGEVERDGADIVGRNVSLACRLCDVAAPGEVLASAMVADLADSSSDLTFGDDRELRLAGIERPVHARPASRRP